MAIRAAQLCLKKFLPHLIIILVTLLSACGGGSDDAGETTTADSDTSTPDSESEVVATSTCDNGSTETAEVKQIGTVSGVEGLAYESESIATVDGVKKTISGITTASGEYEYYEVCGETSETDICHVKKCIDATAEEILSGAEIIAAAEIENSRVRPGIIGRFTSTTEPKTIRDVIYATYADESDEERKRITVNVYQFLMALDDDGDPNNGVRVSERKLELGQQFADKIDFTRSDFDDRDEVKEYLRNVVEKENIEIGSDENAKLFLQENLAAQNRFIVSGKVIGTTEKVTLILNGAETVTQSLDGRFFFHTELQTGDEFHIQIIESLTDPTCRIGRNRGIIEDSSINDVIVGCGDFADANPDEGSLDTFDPEAPTNPEGSDPTDPGFIEPDGELDSLDPLNPIDGQPPEEDGGLLDPTNPEGEPFPEDEFNPTGPTDPTDPNNLDGSLPEEPLDSTDPALEDGPIIGDDPNATDPTVI